MTRTTIQPDRGYYWFQLGSYRCAVLYDGFYDYQLEQMFANVPRSHAQAALQAQGLDTQIVRTPYNYLYIHTGSHQLLVDTGAGNRTPNTGKLQQNMKAAGISIDEIDSVIITHAHPDHVGGLLDADGAPVFSRATHSICKAEWDFWFSEEAPILGGELMSQTARQKLAPIEDRVALLEQDGEVHPGVSVIFTPGHTPGHMSVVATSQGEQVIYTGDTALHPLHLEYPDWYPVFDMNPAQAAVSKKRICNLSADTHCRVIVQHFAPFPGLGQIVRQGTGWRWQPDRIDA
jgi:glyoxylase-like metal-dependent hydrolase (beta-lactamase superfamily II)